MKPLPILLIFMLFTLQCTYLVNKLAFFPDRQNNVRKQDLPVQAQDLFITTPDRKKLQILQLSDPNSSYILLYFHGNAGNISGRLFDLQLLNSMGLNVIGLSYRGYGKSMGKPSEKGIYIDGLTAYHYAHDTLGFNPENIIIMGRSIGTTVAIEIARRRNLAGLILVTPMTTGAEYISYHGLGFLAWIGGDAFNNSKKIKDIICPSLIIHGTNDKTVPYHMGKSLHQSIKHEQKKFVSINGAGHNDLSYNDKGKYWESLKQYIMSIAKYSNYSGTLIKTMICCHPVPPMAGF